MMPINIEEVERQRRRHESICSVKSLFCCLSVLVGKHSYTNKSSLSKKRKKRQTQHHVVRSFEDDDSFGHNFDDDEQMSPRVMTRLSSVRGHNFD